MKNEENIFLKKHGYCEAVFVVGCNENGEKIYDSVLADTREAAAKKRNEAIYELNLKNQEVSDSSIVTFGEITENWLEYIKPDVKESTYCIYHMKIYNHIIPDLGHYKDIDINKKVIKDFKDKLLLQGLSSKTVKDILTVVKSIIKFAGIPCGDLKDIKVKKENKVKRVLNEQEQKKLTTVLLENINRIKIGILLSLYMGLRIGEVCALQRKHIDFENGILKVRQTIQRIKDIDSKTGKKTKVVITAPKSESSIRNISIPKILIPYLKLLISDKPDTYILTGTNKYMEPRTLQNHFKKIIEESMIESANYHSTRHGFATRALEMGMDIKVLSLVLGHSNIKITLDEYVHPTNEFKMMNMEKVKLAIA